MRPLEFPHEVVAVSTFWWPLWLPHRGLPRVVDGTIVDLDKHWKIAAKATENRAGSVKQVAERWK